jgi:hypothetical protein
MHPDPQSFSLRRFAAKFRYRIAQDIVDRRALAAGDSLLQRRDPARIASIGGRTGCGNDAGIRSRRSLRRANRISFKRSPGRIPV